MENYIINLLVVSSFSSYLINAWFNSTLSAQVFNLFIKKENKLYTKDEVDNYLLTKPFFLHSLLTCPICMAFHLSLWATLAVWLGRYNLNPGDLDIFESVSILFISASIAASFGSKNEKKITKSSNTPKQEQPTQMPKLKFEPTKKKSSKEKSVEDYGGYLLETLEDGTKKVVGMTKVYTDYAQTVFDENGKCNFPKCKQWKEEFNAEIKALEEQHSKNGKACPECIKSGVKRKFYDIIKKEIELLQKK